MQLLGLSNMADASTSKSISIINSSRINNNNHLNELIL